MPQTTPEIKVEAVKSLGAEVVLVGDHYTDAQRHSERLTEESGLVFVRPFDDPLVIAGQGTILWNSSDRARTIWPRCWFPSAAAA